MDKLAPERRSANMRAIRSANTLPELAVRRALLENGFGGYRLHRKELPGKPDIAFLGRKKAILVNGCFWHGHDCAEGLRRPRSRQYYWLPKDLCKSSARCASRREPDCSGLERADNLGMRDLRPCPRGPSRVLHGWAKHLICCSCPFRPSGYGKGSSGRYPIPYLTARHPLCRGRNVFKGSLQCLSSP